ncbi:hypothetical protein H4Q26_013564 [Puccinia striiformis f. sp. tritici PST-130]|nr:hypothetical protein H4Q26_013564 [Puccinia striiformis f. sp. tritici PST-130]
MVSKQKKRKTAATNQQEEEQEQNDNQVELERTQRIYDDFKNEDFNRYFDIIDQTPLDLNRKLSCITELESSLQECQQELQEDLIAYTDYSKSVTSVPTHQTQQAENETQDDLTNRLRTLAEPNLWGIIPALPPPSSSTLPEELKTLLTEISTKMIRLQDLNHDKLNLAESIYTDLDRQLKRLDYDLESFMDLEDMDVHDERRLLETSDNHHHQSRLATPHQSPSRKPITTPNHDQRLSPSQNHGKRTLRSTSSRPDSPNKGLAIRESIDSPKKSTPQKTGKSSTTIEAGTSTRLTRQSIVNHPSSSEARGKENDQIEEETNPIAPSTSLNSVDDQSLYCYCQQISFGDMVACDNLNCKGGQWFHLGCIGLNYLPGDNEDEKWFCKECIQLSDPSVLDEHHNQSGNVDHSKRTSLRKK